MTTANQHAWLLLVWLGSVLASTAPVLPTVMVATSDPYQLGYQSGQVFKDRILAVFNEYQSLFTEVLDFTGTSEGTQIYQAFLQANTEYYPDYVEEIRGLADAVGISFEEMMIMNLQGEYSAIYSASTAERVVTTLFASQRVTDHCTDILTKTKDFVGLGHNEDGSEIIQETAYLLQAQLSYPNNPQSFTAYIYPGQLGGNAFSWSAASGMIWTVNALYPVEVIVGGRGQYFIMRDALRATSIDEAIQLLNVSQSASGFSMNIASVNEMRLVNVEVAPGDFQISVVEVPPSGWFHHENMYKHSNVEQYANPSSLHRAERVEQLGQPLISE